MSEELLFDNDLVENTMTQREISTEIRQLETSRREFMANAMHDFDVKQRIRLNKLRALCRSIGHKWRFTHLGPLGDPWYNCTICHSSKTNAHDNVVCPKKDVLCNGE